MMKILIADDMEYARANIMELVKNIFPEAEIDEHMHGKQQKRENMTCFLPMSG